MDDMAKQIKQEAEKRARMARDQAMIMAAKRKEEYLGARVPKVLKEKVIARAEEMGIPVSLLVRRALEEVFLGETDSPDKPQEEVAGGDSKYNAVLGWKELELNREHACDRCQSSLSAGMEAIMGITSDEGVVIICRSCKEQLKA